MEDNFEWEEYKEKVDELTRKFEELKDQVSGEAAEDSDLFSGIEATPPRQNITHYVGNLGDTLSIGNYQELKDAFEVFAKASEADGRVKVIHGDTLVGSAGTNDKIYCLVTVADEASLSGFQSSSPAPFNGEHVWGYHIWTSASGSGGDCCCCCCKDPYSNTLSFEHTGMGGLNWNNVSYDLETCSYHASTTSNNQYANGGNFSGNFLIDFKYTESRGWQLTLTTDQFAIVSTEQIYTGGGTGSGYALDLADDFHPCNVDIPAAIGFAGNPGVLRSTSSEITVT